MHIFTFSILITVSFRVIPSIFPYCTRKSIIRASSVTFSFPLSGSAMAAVVAANDDVDGTVAFGFDDCRVSGILPSFGVIVTDMDEAHSNDTLELVTNVACRFSIGAGIFQEPAGRMKKKNDYFIDSPIKFPRQESGTFSEGAGRVVWPVQVDPKCEGKNRMRYDTNCLGRLFYSTKTSRVSN